MNDTESHQVGKLLCSAAVLCLLSLGGSAEAQVRDFASGEEATPTVADLSPSLASGEAYSERYSVSLVSEDGVEIYLNWSISNLGWGDGHGSAKVTVKFPDRENYEFQKTVARDAWTSRDEGFGLEIAGTTIRATEGGAFEIGHEGDVSLALTMRSDLPIWSPGCGRLEVGEDGYLERHVFGLRARATGHLDVDGEERSFESTRGGYADHVETNLAPFDLAKRFSRARLYEPKSDVFVAWRETRLVDEFGGESVTWVVVAYGDKIVFADADAVVKFGRIRSDKVGYRVPHAVQVEGRSDGDRIKLVMRAERKTRTDLLDGYGRLARVIAESVSKPYSFFFDATYELELKIGGKQAVVRGEGGYTVDMLN